MESDTTTNAAFPAAKRWWYFLLWFAMLVAGFGYVSIALCDRTNPFQSGNNVFVDFLALALASPLLFYLGPNQNLTPVTPPEQSTNPALFRIGLIYVASFFLLLHWEFVGKLLGTHFSLTAHHMHSLEFRSLLAVIAALSIISSLILFHLILAWQSRIFTKYVMAFCLVVFLVFVTHMVLCHSYYIHIHHYCLGLFLVPFFRFRNLISVIAQGAFLGLGVEGIARWGLDPVWYTLN